MISHGMPYHHMGDYHYAHRPVASHLSPVVHPTHLHAAHGYHDALSLMDLHHVHLRHHHDHPLYLQHLVDSKMSTEDQKKEIATKASIENADDILINLDAVGYGDLELMQLSGLQLEEVEDWCGANDDHKQKCNEMAKLVNTPVEYEELMLLDEIGEENIPNLNDYLMNLSVHWAQVFEYM